MAGRRVSSWGGILLLPISCLRNCKCNCLFRKFRASGDCDCASTPCPCLIAGGMAIPPEHALSSYRKRPNSSCGPSCPRLSSTARHADDGPAAFTASLKGLSALKAATVEAEMSSVSPVPGLCPVRARAPPGAEGPEARKAESFPSCE